MNLGRTFGAVILLNILASSPAGAQTYLTYRLAAPQGCNGRVPSHPNIPVPRDNSLYWSGRCVEGWMEGMGELDRFRDGTLVERDLTQMSGGIRSGSDVTIDVDPNSFTYRVRTYSRWQNGFPYGEVRAFANNTVVNVWQADGRGGVEQSMNPLNPILQLFGPRYSQLSYFLQLFAPQSPRQVEASAATCYALMRGQGFTEDTARMWCTM